MLTVGVLRSGQVKTKGPLHVKLQKLLHDAWAAKLITQESLAKAIGNSQENTGQYLRGGKAGALDVDQADAALRHIGSSLIDFLSGEPPRGLSASEKLARELTARPDLQALIEDLLPVPKTRLSALIELVRGVAPLATLRPPKPTAESRPGTRPGGRTTKGPKKHR